MGHQHSVTAIASMVAHLCLRYGPAEGAQCKADVQEEQLQTLAPDIMAEVCASMFRRASLGCLMSSQPGFPWHAALQTRLTHTGSQQPCQLRLPLSADSIDSSDVVLGELGRGAKGLPAMLAKLPNLSALDVSGQGFGADAMCELLRAVSLRARHTLKALDVSRNPLLEAPARSAWTSSAAQKHGRDPVPSIVYALAGALQLCTALQDIGALGCIAITTNTKSCKVLGDSLARLVRVTRLALSGVAYSTGVAPILQSATALQRLELPDMLHPGLACAIAKLQRLTYLDLQRTWHSRRHSRRHSSDEVKDICGALLEHKCIQWLNLAFCGADVVDLKLASLPQLRHLDLNGFHSDAALRARDVEGAQAADLPVAEPEKRHGLRGLAQLTRLTYLRLGCTEGELHKEEECYFRPSEAMAIAAALAALRALHTLHLASTARFGSPHAPMAFAIAPVLRVLTCTLHGDVPVCSMLAALSAASPANAPQLSMLQDLTLRVCDFGPVTSDTAQQMDEQLLTAVTSLTSLAKLHLHKVAMASMRQGRRYNEGPRAFCNSLLAQVTALSALQDVHIANAVLDERARCGVVALMHSSQLTRIALTGCDGVHGETLQALGQYSLHCIVLDRCMFRAAVYNLFAAPVVSAWGSTLRRLELNVPGLVGSPDMWQALGKLAALRVLVLPRLCEFHKQQCSALKAKRYGLLDIKFAA